jgi:hypothetical protein
VRKRLLNALLSGAGFAALLTALAGPRDWLEHWDIVAVTVVAAAAVWPVLGILAAEALFLPSASDRARLTEARDRERELRRLLDRIEREQTAERPPRQSGTGPRRRACAGGSGVTGWLCGANVEA